MKFSRNTVLRGLSFLVCSLMLVPMAAAYDYSPEITAALEKKDTTEVLNQIEKALTIDVNYAPLYLLRGKIFYQRGKYGEAMEQFDIALDKKSKLYEALYYKGLVYLKEDSLKQAKKVFDQGMKKAKDEKALFHNGIGLYDLAMGQEEDNREFYTKADVEFRRAIQEGPDRAEFHANLGDANYFNEIYPLAISEYNRVLELDTTNLDIYFRLARAYVAQNQFSKALEQLRTVLVRDSMYAAAWKEAGKLYTLAGISANDKAVKEQRLKEGLGSYLRYMELSHDSSDVEVFFNMGRSYFLLGGFEQADSSFNKVLSMGVVPKNIYLYLGRSKIATHDYQEGIDYIKKHIAWLQENEPDWKPTAADADMYARMGGAYNDQEDYFDAAENFVKASDLDTTNAYYAVQAALAYHHLKEFDKALKYYQRRIAIGPDDPSIFLNASYCTTQLEDYEKTIEYLSKVVELDSTNVKAVELLSNTYYYRLKDCANGVKWTKRLIELDSSNCDAYETMGLIYFTEDAICTKDNLKAVSYFKKALDCFRAKGMESCGNADIMLYIAQGYHLYAADVSENKAEYKKNMKNAFDWYNKVLKCDPGNKSAQDGKRDTEFEF